MSSQDPSRAGGHALTPLPRLEDLPRAGEGFERDKVGEAFDAFRRHVTALQAQLRVLQAAPRSAITEPSGHAVRMDALHLIRSAAEFADTIERDAQEAAAKQVGKAEQEIRESQMELQQREAEIARIRQETERQRGEIMNAARNEAREILTKANRDSSSELHDAETRGNRLLEQSRHQATELDELRPRRGRADPRMGPRAGRRHRSARAHGRRAASVRSRSRRGGDPGGRRRDRPRRAVLGAEAERGYRERTGRDPGAERAEPEEAPEEDTEAPESPGSPSAAAEAADDERPDDNAAEST